MRGWDSTVHKESHYHNMKFLTVLHYTKKREIGKRWKIFVRCFYSQVLIERKMGQNGEESRQKRQKEFNLT